MKDSDKRDHNPLGRHSSPAVLSGHEEEAKFLAEMRHLRSHGSRHTFSEAHPLASRNVGMGAKQENKPINLLKFLGISQPYCDALFKEDLTAPSPQCLAKARFANRLLGFDITPMERQWNRYEKSREKLVFALTTISLTVVAIALNVTGVGMPLKMMDHTAASGAAGLDSINLMCSGLEDLHQDRVARGSTKIITGAGVIAATVCSVLHAYVGTFSAAVVPGLFIANAVAAFASYYADQQEIKEKSKQLERCYSDLEKHTQAGNTIAIAECQRKIQRLSAAISDKRRQGKASMAYAVALALMGVATIGIVASGIGIAPGIIALGLLSAATLSLGLKQYLSYREERRASLEHQQQVPSPSSPEDNGVQEEEPHHSPLRDSP